MKRYTGQKALYEAISRSQAKAKRGNILEKLRVQPAPPDQQADQGPRPVAEPNGIPAAAPPPLVGEPAQPTAEEQPPELPVVEKQAVEEKPQPVVEKAELQELIERPAPPVVRLRPVERLGGPTPPSPVKPWLRPKAVQLNGGRVEISVPYHVGVAVALAATLVVLAAFRLGQKYNGAPVPPAAKVNPPVRPAPQDAVPTKASRPQTETPVGSARAPEPVPLQASQPSQGDHWIVLAQHRQKNDLDEVQKYFAQNGIDLIVLAVADVRKAFAERGLDAARLPSGEGYLLVTNGLFSNPERSGTDGYRMKQKITEVGKGYKAPSGKESFAPNYFSDAYPMKVRIKGES